MAFCFVERTAPFYFYIAILHSVCFMGSVTLKLLSEVLARSLAYYKMFLL